jgi:hypothetical protein
LLGEHVYKQVLNGCCLGKDYITATITELLYNCCSKSFLAKEHPVDLTKLPNASPYTILFVSQDDGPTQFLIG